MSVAVYLRLTQLLKDKHLTVAELGRQMEERYGISANAKTLYQLAQDAPVQRADLEIAGAAAAILGVGLGDLFTVEAVAVADEQGDEASVLGPEDSRRMAALVDLQGRRLLTNEEWAELRELVATYGQLLHERRLRERARRGVSLEREQRETEEHLARALDELQPDEIEAWQDALVERTAEQEQAQAQVR